jgi:hypothetical protein
MKKQFWTDNEIEYLKLNYSNNRTDKIANILGRTIYQVYNKVHSLKLKKSAEFLASPESGIFIKGSTTGKEHRFKKGIVPHNKGKKMSPELYEKVSKTFFKKGHKPHNTKFDGAITIRNHKRSGIPYKCIRVEESKWEFLHRLNWEKTNGPIPKGFNVVFKDGNTMNCELSNLELLSDSELLSRNTLHQYPKDLQEVIKLNNKLKNQING